MGDIKRYFLEFAYKGTNYHGWQLQHNAHSVQSEMEGALELLFGRPVSVMGSGRTDTGVHASQQFLHFDLDGDLEPKMAVKKLNGILPKDIAVYDLRAVRSDAHARFSALWRSYEYVISLRKNPFKQGLSWYCYYDLDMEKMNEAASVLLEHRDFQCFSKIHTDVKHFDCKIKEAYWEQKESYLIFHITANRFLRGMVRAIVGTMVQVGTGKINKEDFRQIILSKDRKKAGANVPADGLFLSKVVYPDVLFT
ncbi:tRNA pseudouridine(38-40) synthase TruA [Pararhodonellum marinum]|uniref:tRNA pseudouridine(38-40) synthase TruA n=1 Tax=Pararhodonellum marinum TaxID=2755358 RepID=UPI00188DF9DD|nr:tRNA pseudouridine(38-40) synthase TruA [Pararhodonellum marinum]